MPVDDSGNNDMVVDVIPTSECHPPIDEELEKPSAKLQAPKKNVSTAAATKRQRVHHKRKASHAPSTAVDTHCTEEIVKRNILVASLPSSKKEERRRKRKLVNSAKETSTGAVNKEVVLDLSSSKKEERRRKQMRVNSAKETSTGAVNKEVVLDLSSSKKEERRRKQMRVNSAKETSTGAVNKEVVLDLSSSKKEERRRMQKRVSSGKETSTGAVNKEVVLDLSSLLELQSYLDSNICNKPMAKLTENERRVRIVRDAQIAALNKKLGPDWDPFNESSNQQEGVGEDFKELVRLIQSKEVSVPPVHHPGGDVAECEASGGEEAGSAGAGRDGGGEDEKAVPIQDSHIIFEKPGSTENPGSIDNVLDYDECVPVEIMSGENVLSDSTDSDCSKSPVQADPVNSNEEQNEKSGMDGTSTSRESSENETSSNCEPKHSTEETREDVVVRQRKRTAQNLPIEQQSSKVRKPSVDKGFRDGRLDHLNEVVLESSKTKKMMSLREYNRKYNISARAKPRVVKVSTSKSVMPAVSKAISSEDSSSAGSSKSLVARSSTSDVEPPESVSDSDSDSSREELLMKSEHDPKTRAHRSRFETWAKKDMLTERSSDRPAVKRMKKDAEQNTLSKEYELQHQINALGLSPRRQAPNSSLSLDFPPDIKRIVDEFPKASKTLKSKARAFKKVPTESTGVFKPSNPDSFTRGHRMTPSSAESLGKSRQREFTLRHDDDSLTLNSSPIQSPIPVQRLSQRSNDSDTAVVRNLKNPSTKRSDVSKNNDDEDWSRYYANWDEPTYVDGENTHGIIDPSPNVRERAFRTIASLAKDVLKKQSLLGTDLNKKGSRVQSPNLGKRAKDLGKGATDPCSSSSMDPDDEDWSQYYVNFDEPTYIDGENSYGVFDPTPHAAKRTAKLIDELRKVAKSLPVSILKKQPSIDTDVKKKARQVQSYDKIGSFLPLTPSTMKLITNAICSHYWDGQPCEGNCKKKHKIRCDDFPGVLEDAVFRAVSARLIELERPQREMVVSFVEGLGNRKEIVKILSFSKMLLSKKAFSDCCYFGTVFLAILSQLLQVEKWKVAQFLMQLHYVLMKKKDPEEIKVAMSKLMAYLHVNTYKLRIYEILRFVLDLEGYSLPFQTLDTLLHEVNNNPPLDIMVTKEQIKRQIKSFEKIENQDFRARCEIFLRKY